MRKVLFRTLTFAALFCILLTASVFAEEAVVTGSDVNFRSGPSVDYAIYECLPKGTVVTVTDRSDSEWYAVTYNGRSGYINSAYLSITSAPAPDPDPNTNTGGADFPSAQTEGLSGTVNAMYVRFRSGPGTDYSILGEYNRGTALTVTGSSGSWYAIVINGQSGYMYADYVTVGGSVDPEPAPAPTPTPAPPAEPIAVTPTGNQAGHIRGDYVYFRSGPSKYYSIYDCLSNGTALTITGRSGEWYAVTIDGTSGYVYNAYVVNDDGGSVPNVSDPDPEPTPVPDPEPTSEPQTNTGTPGYITGNDVRFRSGPGTRYDILGEYNYGTALTITGSSGEWKAVILNGRSGYVYGQYVSQGSATTVSDDPNSSALGKQIVEFALKYQGYNYTWGGTSPETGFDCSGFTTFVYGHFGIQLHRVACDQAAYDGVQVSTSSLQLGDLLCFYSSSDYVGHVGIYIGNNRFIHSSTYTTGVIISDLSGYYDARGYIAKRLG